ncbi:MAG: 30S ribosomal protein S17 [Candidatus Woesearchaeota archaeon]
MDTKVKCDDQNCPIHGRLRTHGKTFIGKVIKTGMQKTATVEWTRLRKVQKYERYEKKRTRIKVHNSACINAATGDTVKIMESRPISKTKHFAIIEKVQ